MTTKIYGKEQGLTRDRLIGMHVIDGDAYDIGTVKDISFTVGKVGMNLIVETKRGETRVISWEEIQAAGDFITLRPSTFQPQQTQFQSQQTQTPVCPTCGGPLTYIQQYQRWYCYKDKEYV